MNTSKPNETSRSRLSFTGTSSSGDLTEALKDALKKAADSLGEANVAWKIERTGGDQLALGPISVTIQISPGEGEGGVGPH
jgi:flavin-binding protein dodecin